MSAIKDAIEIITQFVGLAKELAKLPALVLPQYHSAAVDLYEICQKLLNANENMSRWLHRLRYFDFYNPVARNEFLNTIEEYKIMKSGPEIQKMKIICHDIANIYYRDISSKIGNWFVNRQKKEEVEGTFAKLTDADMAMVEFISDEVIGKIDQFVEKVEQEVDAGNLDRAEELRLEFKSETMELVQN